MTENTVVSIFHDVEELLSESTQEFQEKCARLHELLQEIIKKYDMAQNELSEVSAKLREMKNKSTFTIQEALEEHPPEEQNLRKVMADLEVKTAELRNALQHAEFLYERFNNALKIIKGEKDEKPEEQELASPRGSLNTLLALEDERKRIARDIHDGPAQNLANVVLRLDLVKKMFIKDQGKAMGELDMLKEIVRESLQEVRRFIFNLRPMSIDDLGFIPTLRRYIQDFLLRSGLEVDFVILGDEKRMPPAIEISLFRISQEALSNILKHAQAKNVRVAVDIEKNFVMLNIKDNGKGFNMAERQSSGGKSKYESLGLVSMKERTELLGGEYTIKSTPGEGTSIIVKIPIQ